MSEQPVRRWRWVAVNCDGKWKVGIAEPLGGDSWDGNPYAVVTCVDVLYDAGEVSAEMLAKRIAQALTYMEIMK